MKKKQKQSTGNIFLKNELRLQKKQSPMIGIDIGSNYIKIVQMKNYRLNKLGVSEIPEGIINQGRIEALDPLVEVIKRTMKSNKIKGKECALCLSTNELIVRELKMPEMGESQIMDNIRHEITSFLPLNHDEYCIDYKILDYKKAEGTDSGELRLLVAAVPNTVVRTYINTLKKAGLKVVYVDVLPSIAGKLCKWISIQKGTAILNNFCMIDFGARTTQIIILKNGNYFIHKIISGGGDYLTGVIADKSGMDMIEAEEYKKKTNFFNGNINNGLSQYVIDAFDYLMRDFDRTIEYYKNRNNQAEIDRIYIMGGGALMEGLTGYMRKQFSSEVYLISEGLELFPQSNNSKKNVAIFTQAIGATMREEW
jgi:type IV pilus assembly protein PilM